MVDNTMDALRRNLQRAQEIRRRRISGDSPKDRLKLFWRRAFQREASREKDRYVYRVILVYRFVREVAQTLGRLHPSQPISEILPSHGGPLKNFLTGEVTPPVSTSYPLTPVRKQIRHIYLEHDLCLGPPRNLPKDPDLTSPYLEVETQQPKRKNIRMRAFMRVFDLVSSSLGFLQGSAEDPEQGIKGLIGLDNPYTVHMYWPVFTDLIEYETSLVELALDRYVSRGEQYTRKYLVHRFGLTHDEIKTIIALSRTEARDRVDMDIETQRAMAVLRLENIMLQAQKCLSINAQIRAAKELHLVVGLGKASPDDAMRAFGDAVAELALERHGGGSRTRELRSAMPPTIEAKALVSDGLNGGNGNDDGDEEHVRREEPGGDVGPIGSDDWASADG